MTEANPVTVDAFETFVQENNFVIVKASADWCGPCKRIEPDVNDMCKKLDEKIRIITIDIDNDEELCEYLEIEKIPTFINYIKGKKADIHVGANVENLKHFFEKTEAHTLFE